MRNSHSSVYKLISLIGQANLWTSNLGEHINNSQTYLREITKNFSHLITTFTTTDVDNDV